MFSEKQIKEVSKDVATDIIESGLIDNAKPIYCHSLDIKFDTSGRIACMIFNNDETPFTMTSFVQYLNDLYDKIQAVVRIMATGVIAVGGTIFPAEVLVRRQPSDANKFGITSQTVAGDSTALNFQTDESFIAAPTIFVDTVFKIN